MKSSIKGILKSKHLTKWFKTSLAGAHPGFSQGEGPSRNFRK